MALSISDLEHVLTLAHLEIAQPEKATYLAQLGGILQYMEELNALDLSAIGPSSYANDQPTLLRDDVLRPTTGLALATNAPDWEGNAFRVPKILDA